MRLLDSLRNALTVHFLTAAVVPMLIFGVIASEYLTRELTEQVYLDLNGNTESIRDETDEFLNEIHTDLVLIGKVVTASMLDGPDEINRFLETAVRNSQFLESVYVLDKERRIVNLGLSEEQQGHRNDYLGLDFSAHDVFLQHPSITEPLWSDTFVSLVTSEPSITLVLPGREGQTLFGFISLNHLNRFLTRNRSHEGAMKFALVDHRGTLVAHSDAKLALQRQNYLNHPEVRAALESGVEVNRKYHEDQSLLESVRLLPRAGWVVYASLPTKVALKDVHRFHMMLIITLSVATFLGILIAFVTSRRLIKPILALRETSVSLARGEYGMSASRSHYSELNDLAENFQRMAQAVQEREESIREQERRYRELVESIEGIVWELDVETFRFTYVSSQAEQILGYPLERWINEPDFWKDHIHPEDREWAFSFCAAKTAEHEDHDFEYRMIAADGRVVWLRDIVSVVVEEARPVRLRGVMFDLTARKESETLLQESERRFRTIFQTSPDAIMISQVDDGKIIDVNEHLLGLGGYEREALVGRISTEAGLWADLADRDRFMEILRNNGEVDNFEAKLRKYDGEVRTGLMSARPVSIDNQKCLVTVIRDISSIKAAEQNLRRSEERFRSLVGIMGEGLIIQTSNGVVVECNQAAERILGRTRDQLLGQTSHDDVWHAVHQDGSRYGPEDHPSMVTLKTGEAVHNRVMGLVQDDGSIKWVQINAEPISLDLDGRPTAVVVTFSDVTALKLVEENLRENEANLQQLSQQFQGLLEAIPDRIVVLDRDMRIIWINVQNPEKEDSPNPDLIGAHCFEVVGMHCNTVVGGTFSTCPECPVARCFESGEPTEIQKQNRSGRTLALRAIPIKDANTGEVINVIEIGQDITERIIIQEQNIRTGQLAALGELAAGVAHEINNPVNGIINYAQLLLNHTDDGSREQNLSERIIKEGDRIATIVKELLFFAREGGHETSLTTIHAALEEALSLSEVHLRKEGIHVEKVYAENLPSIETRSHQISQLFLNLISNSRHALNEKFAGDHPDKKITITAEQVEVDGERFVQVRFHDNGTGIPPEIKHRALNPFVTTKPSGVGTGLGLSISHEIVQKHGGRMRVESDFGRYTEIIFELPAVTVG